MGNGSSEPESEQFSYKGYDVSISQSGDEATIKFDGQNFSATRRAGMWSSPGVFNHYRLLGDLARHIIDYLHQFTPGQ
jgi:hypothetical protein